MSMRKIYREVAKKHGVSVKEEMQKALDHAYSNTADDGVIVAYQKQVPSKGDIPTPEEFIKYAVNKVKE
ncbi:Sporulation initiation factor Spo0A C terminal [Anaerosphaera aminiphila DSM 21120]|uniref:Sporulation initiation factor Spo0A C terminal n=1 Tax=Anaerosphaera aminiphila DSM 21120 TaxID=1120995 RepID=A0A1M5SH67_9FIRM|nr:sporulation initiation factor Spo0A C-terminal domain-containing protein [Anaerosphaera aminiphila]SHH37839.1 Sporulation initiation factor Spo0A C terminal [Anaerosphaera aminiphila DSM 21120]